MNKVSIAAALALSAVCGSANAQGLFSFDKAEGGLFVSGFVGSASPGDAELSGPMRDLDAEFDSAASYGGAVGYRLPFKYWTYFQPRLELEISGTESDLSSARLNGGPRSATGNLSTTYFLFNNYNDISWSENQSIVPFLGGGIGAASIDLELQEDASIAGLAASTISDSATALATTFAGGLTWHATDAVEFYGEARYTTVYGAEFDRFETGSTAARSLEDDLSNTSFTVGARLSF